MPVFLNFLKLQIKTFVRKCYECSFFEWTAYYTAVSMAEKKSFYHERQRDKKKRCSLNEYADEGIENRKRARGWRICCYFLAMCNSPLAKFVASHTQQWGKKNVGSTKYIGMKITYNGDFLTSDKKWYLRGGFFKIKLHY